MVTAILRLLFGLVSVCIAVPCLFFGLLGVTGYLSDTSERENLHQGLTFFGIAAAALAIGVGGIVLAGRLGGPVDDGPEDA